VESDAQTPAGAGFRMPAEWEPHRATWLAWPHNARDWPHKLATIRWVFTEIARHLVEGERVRLIVEPRTEARARRALRLAGVPLGRVEFRRAATDRSWTRDFMPLFVVRRRGGRREVAAVKFRFDAWARYPNFARDEAAGWRMARQHGRTFRPEVVIDGRRRRPVLEGGAIDVDGQGTLLATETCLLGRRFGRNPGLGRAGTERLLAEQLGVQKVLWLRRGIAGDDTSGHVDDFVRFVRPGVVVLCREPARGDANHRPLAEARERLRGARDARGRRLEIVPLPMPQRRFFAGQRLPASYANFYFANGVLLVPTFDDPMDRRALGLLAELCPTRRVVGIHALDLVWGFGTLHCSTMQEPA
jgi:agmatine deiminase